MLTSHSAPVLALALLVELAACKRALYPGAAASRGIIDHQIAECYTPR